MASLTRQAVIVSVSRFLNQGLMLISPIVLVSLMSVNDFGEYREFLLYATLVGNLAAFSLAASLLYFVGREPEAAWGHVRRICIMVAVCSVLTVAVFAALDRLWPGHLIGPQLLPCILYVLFYVNVDFWEFLWLVQKRPGSVLAYTSGRLVGRMCVVILATLLTDDIAVIVWSLVALEACRLVISAYFWRRVSAREGSAPVKASWREQLDFCVPSGIAVFVTTLNASLGGIFLTKYFGESELAMLVVGGYISSVIYPLRNSVSDVLLPEMSALAARQRHGWLPLFRRSIILFAMLLLPVSIVLARFAETWVTTAFSDRYLAAVPIFQLYCVTIVLSSIDIAIALRATSRTRSMLFANVVVTTVNVVALFALVPRFAGPGATLALILSSIAGIAYLLWHLGRVEELRLAELVPLAGVARVTAAAILPLPLLLPQFWTQRWGLVGALAGSGLYAVGVLIALRLFHIDEARWLIDMVGRRVGLVRGTAGGSLR